MALGSTHRQGLPRSVERSSSLPRPGRTHDPDIGRNTRTRISTPPLRGISARPRAAHKHHTKSVLLRCGMCILMSLSADVVTVQAMIGRRDRDQRQNGPAVLAPPGGVGVQDAGRFVVQPLEDVDVALDGLQGIVGMLAKHFLDVFCVMPSVATDTRSGETHRNRREGEQLA